MAPRIKLFRKELRISIEEAAQLLNITVENYASKEDGSASFTKDELFILWNFFTPALEKSPPELRARLSSSFLDHDE